MESFTASVMRTPEKADRSDIMLADATAETERLIKETTVAVESVIREETIRMMTKDWTGLVDMNKPSDGDRAKVKATLKKSTEEYADDYNPSPTEQKKYKDLGYLSLAGSLLWLSRRCYPNLLFATSQLCSVMSMPSEHAWNQ
eukprot:COSAG05_NODE_8138_length_732_cov_2.867299_1_plen_142_part_10